MLNLYISYIYLCFHNKDHIIFTLHEYELTFSLGGEEGGLLPSGRQLFNQTFSQQNQLVLMRCQDNFQLFLWQTKPDMVTKSKQDLFLTLTNLFCAEADPNHSLITT